MLQAGGGPDDPVVTAYGDVDRQLDSLSAALDLLVGCMSMLTAKVTCTHSCTSLSTSHLHSRNPCLPAPATIARSSPRPVSNHCSAGLPFIKWQQAAPLLRRTSAATASRPRWQRSGLRCSRTSPADCMRRGLWMSNSCTWLRTNSSHPVMESAGCTYEHFHMRIA